MLGAYAVLRPSRDETAFQRRRMLVLASMPGFLRLVSPSGRQSTIISTPSATIKFRRAGLSGPALQVADGVSRVGTGASERAPVEACPL